MELVGSLVPGIFMALVGILALALLGPVILDLASIFGIRMSWRTDKLVAVRPLDFALVGRFVTGLCCVLVVLSGVFNLGWFRILLALPMVAHLVLFRWSALRLLKNRPILLFLVADWTAFVVGYLLLPDFGDTDDSVRVFFGLMTNEPMVDLLMAVSVCGLLTSAVLVALAFFLARKRPEA